MLARALERSINAQAFRAKPFGDWLHGLVAAIVGRGSDLLQDAEVVRLYLGAWGAAHRRPPHTIHTRT